MAEIKEISKIQLPSGVIYDIKDTVAREAISGGLFKMAWTKSQYEAKTAPTTADLEKIPAGVKVTISGSTTEYTGTLAAAAAVKGAFYFVYTAKKAEDQDVYEEYVAVLDGAESYRWEKVGDTKFALDVQLNKGEGDNVLGEATTFTAAASNVSFAAHTTDEALGSGATFTTTVTPSKTKLSATASGCTVGDTKDVFIKEVSATTSKLLKGSVHDTPTLDKKYLKRGKVNQVSTNVEVDVPVVSESGVEASKISSNAEVEATKITGFGTLPNLTMVVSGDTSETLEISWSAGALATGTTVTATNTVYTGVTASKVTLGDPVKASKITTSEADVATGQLSDSTDGAAIGVGLTAGTELKFATGALGNSGDGAEVATGLANPTIASAVTSVNVTAQPTITIASGATSGVEVAIGIESASTGVDNADKVTAITALGAATAAAQAITVGANDKVKVAKYDDLSVTVK